MAKEPDTYCLCKCERCGRTWREWIRMRSDSFSYALCSCERCKMVVNAFCIPLDLHYAW